MKKRIFLNSIIVIIIFFLASSCATFKSNITGKYSGETQKHYNAEKVSVCFVVSHYRQTIGYDAIPKLDNKREIIDGFDDFFLDALNEITNIKEYASFTKYASDVNEVKRRHLKDSLINNQDYVIEMKFMRDKSFSKFFFSYVGSIVSATVLPMPYKYNYSLDVIVFDSNQKHLKTYTRDAHLTKWVQTFMIFLYPFYPEKRKKEELYVEMMHDVFKQIDSEGILK